MLVYSFSFSSQLSVQHSKIYLLQTDMNVWLSKQYIDPTNMLGCFVET